MKKFNDADALAQVGRRIQQLREQADKSQTELAALLPVPPATLRNWEQGRRDPGVSGIFALAKHLGVLPTALLEPAPKGWQAKTVRPGRPRKLKDGEAGH